MTKKLFTREQKQHVRKLRLDILTADTYAKKLRYEKRLDKYADELIKKTEASVDEVEYLCYDQPLHP